MNYWLMKSEPDVFSIQHLKAMPDQTEHWNGVRNYQARNLMRDQMSVGDLAFFYHSSCASPGIVGIIEIVRKGYPDHTAFDPTSEYYDPTATLAQPRWYMVDVRYVREFTHPVSLARLKNYPELAAMPLLRKGNRLSVMPVTPEQWDFILTLETSICS
ncbi:EVE domain-containing protein [Gammaproteobacteria bacterium]